MATIDEVIHGPDRRTALAAVGVLQILLGLGCAGLAFVVAGASDRLPAGTQRTALASAFAVYGLAAVYFVSVGVGSMRARRWAQALSVVLSALWTVAGVITTIMTLVAMPRIAHQSTSATTGIITFAALGGVLLPIGLFVFYRSASVRATVERHDTLSRWTDRVPLPVLAVVIVLAFAAIVLLTNLANPVLPLFGGVITGAPAMLTLISLSFLSAFLAVQTYRLKESAWWTLVLLQVIGCVMGAVRLTRLNTGKEIYRDPVIIVVLIATWLGYFAFLIYLKRYFGRIAPRTRREDYSTFSR